MRVFVRDPDKARAALRRRRRAARRRLRRRAIRVRRGARRRGGRLPLGRRRSAPGRVGDGCDRRGRRGGVRRIVKLSSIVAEPGAPVAFWDWHGRIEQHLRAVRRPPCPALQLLHVEPAGRRRAGGARGPALRARRAGEDRDDRPARRRCGCGGRARTSRPRRAHVRPHRPRGRHLRRGRGRALGRDRPRGGVRRRPRRGRASGHDRGRPARASSPSRSCAIFACARRARPRG